MESESKATILTYMSCETLLPDLKDILATMLRFFHRQKERKAASFSSKSKESISI
jgi:hypothetical protein